MHEDLRRRALESGKTVSKRQQVRSQQASRQSSKANSAVNSRAASRVVSRDVSDDEDDTYANLSDETTDSINSIDALLDNDDFNDQGVAGTREQVTAAIDSILERKTSSEARELAIARYDNYLVQHNHGDVLEGRADEIFSALMRSIKSETSSKETLLALRGISLTVLSLEDSGAYEKLAPLLKSMISDSEDHLSKEAAIHCFGICLAFGGAGEEEIIETMTFLLEIISSDGSFIGAEDNVDVAAAALQTYAFLATLVEDIEAESEDAVEAFLEQLNSNSVKVQVAAGEAIALLFEKSYTPREDDEPLSGAEEEEDGSNASDSDHRGDSDLVKRYNAYHNTFEVLEKVTALANLSSKGINKRDRKILHQSFASISMTVENPKVGLQSHSASKLTIRIQREGQIKVDKWWKLMRLNAMRRVLGGGFINHYYEGNKQVLDALPVIVTSTNDSGRPNKLRNGDKYRESRRFVSADTG